MEEEYEIDLRDYLEVLWKKKHIVIAVFLAAIFSSAIFSFFMLQNQYETTTSVLISPPISEMLGEKAGESTFFTPAIYEKLALSNDLLVEIIDRLDLKSADGSPLPPEALRKQMEPKLEIFKDKKAPATQAKTVLLTMKVRGNDPSQIRAIADAWAEIFIEKNADLFASSTAQSYEFIAARYEEVGEELKEKEQQRLELLKANPTTTLESEIAALTAVYKNQLTQLQNKKATLAAQEEKLSALEKELSGRSTSSTLDESILLQIAIENKVYLSLEDYLADVRVSVKTLNASVAYLEGETTRLKREIDEKEAKLQEIKTTLQQLDRDIKTLEKTYSFLSQKLQEARIAKEEQLKSLRIVERAVEPRSPVGPNRLLNIAVAGVLGLFVGVFAAFFAHYIEENGRR